MTSIETRRTWSERVNPRNWTLAWKLVAVGLVPALLALTLGVLRISDRAAEAAALGATTRLVKAREQVREFADALRSERHAAALYLAADRSADVASPDRVHGRTNITLDRLRTVLDGVGPLSDSARAARQQLENRLTNLNTLRNDVAQASDLTPGQVINRYGELIGQAHALDRALLREIRTPGTAGLADALTATLDAAEALALQHTALAVAIRTGSVQQTDNALVANTEHAILAASSEYALALTGDQLRRFGDFAADPAHDSRSQLRDAILATLPDTPVSVSAEDWDKAYQDSKATVDYSADRLRAEIESITRAAEERESNLAGIQSVILMLGMLLAAAIIVLVARSLLRSLRVLRAAALEVAERRLPQAVESIRAGESLDVTIDPVPLRSRDEVGQVARAFDAVHEQAIRLAVDQAALQANISSMFVNLSRRSQALVERQLQLIEQLESNEQDPDQLANLFQLDHLATRMRRNSENLLVLAGTDIGKRNVSPVPVIDVLRAAVSEIEQYQRIVVQPPPTATILGRAASDLVHLLAELLDNATNFSPPDSQVIMSSTRTADGSLLIEISDRGVGMTEHELADANERLAGPSDVDVSVSRRMGLFVVGRLAARHGIGVRLDSVGHGAPGTGLTASVVVPSYLIPTTDLPEMPRTPSRPAIAGSSAEMSPTGPAAAGNRSAAPAAPVSGASGPAQVSGPQARQDASSPAGPRVNGSSSGLPTRRPGATLRPDASTPSPRPTDSNGKAAQSAAQEQPRPRPTPTPQPQARQLEQPDTEPDSTPAEETATAGTADEAANEVTATEEKPAETAGTQQPAAETTSTSDDDSAPAPSTDSKQLNGATPAAAPAPPTRPLPSLPGASGSTSAAENASAQPPQTVEENSLFAPAVPATAEPATFGLGAGRPSEPNDMTETTPIFEEIASAWFRSNRSVPVNWDSGQARGRAGAGAPSTASQQPSGQDAAKEAIPSPSLPPDEQKEPATTLSDEGFATAADEGWRAARNIDAGSDEITAAGLPKRRPRARLVPGSAGSAVLAASAAPARSAESIRGRLASYQQGIRQGRETRLRRAAAASTDVMNGTEPASTGGTDDEETR